MPVSPADFAYWARSTGNKYPETAEEKFAAAPHAYDFVKNAGKSGTNGPSARVGGSIFYSQPESVENSSVNSIFNAPSTPDNQMPKVTGTLDNSLTAEHFENQSNNEAVDRSRQQSLINTIGKTALAAGTVAAGIALARNPGVQQAVRSAGVTVKENAQDIGNRVSTFLGGFGESRLTEPSVIRNSGDVTPPTTAQRYNQAEVPSITQEVQVAKGAPTGSPSEVLLQTKPVTESEVITSSQTFGPKEYEGGSQALREFEAYNPASAEVQAARIETAKQDLLAASKLRNTSYQREIPGTNTTLMALRSPLAGVDLNDPSLGLVQTSAETPSWENGVFLGPVAQTPGQTELNFNQQTSETIPTAGKNLNTNYPYIAKPGEQIVIRPDQAINLTGRGERKSYQNLPSLQEFVNTANAPSPNILQRPVPGEEGNVQFLMEGKPYRATLLPQGESSDVSWLGPASSENSPMPELATLGRSGLADKYAQYGMTVPEKPTNISERVSNYLNRVGGLSDTDQRAATARKQALEIYSTTQDPNVLEAMASGGFPLNVTLPGGEQVPTGKLFTPFSESINPKTGETVTSQRESELLEAQNRHSVDRANALNYLGKNSTEVLTVEDVKQLPEPLQESLTNTKRYLQNAQSANQRAQDFAATYTLRPEIRQGVFESPVTAISPSGGVEVVGMQPTMEREAIPTGTYHKTKSSSGIGRAQVGGVGRRREELANEGFIGATGTELESTPVLYKDVSTNEIFMPGEADLSRVLSGALKPIKGTSVDPGRIMAPGSGRTFKGVSTNIIDPRSFDPEAASLLMQTNPERYDPHTKLFYSSAAMGGQGQAKLRQQQLEAQKSGNLEESIKLGKQIAQSKVTETPGSKEGARFTNMSNEDLEQTILQAGYAGMPEIGVSAENVLNARSQLAQKVESLKASSKILGSSINPTSEYGSSNKQDLKTRAATPLESVTHRAYMHAALAGDMPASQTIALEEPSTTTVRVTRQFKPQQLMVPGAGLVSLQFASDPTTEALTNYMSKRAPSQLQEMVGRIRRQVRGERAYSQPDIF